jgi:O-antigen ligase
VQTPRAVPTADDVPSSSIRPASRVGLTFAALMVSLPFLNFYHAFPLPAFYTEWMAFVLGTAAMVALARDGRVGLPPVSLGLMGLALVLLIQVAAGKVAYAERSLLGAGYALWAALLVWLGAHLREHCGLARIALALQVTLASAGFLVAISGFLLQYQIEWAGVQLVSGDGSQGMAGTIAQRNHFANYLACAIASVVFLYGRRRVSLALAAAIVAPMVLGLVLSISRSAAVFLALVAISACWAFRKEDRAGFRRVAIFCVGALAAFAVLAVLVDSIPWLAGPVRPQASLMERWVETVAPDRSALTSQIRVHLLKEAWAMFAAHPLLGVGFGEFAWNQLERAADFDGIHSPMLGHAHNVLLALLAETGLLGTACVVAPLLAWLRALPWTRSDPDAGWIVAVLVVQAAHSMVEYPLWHANFLGLAALLVGTVSAPVVSLHWGRLRRLMLGLVLAAGLAVLGSVFSDYRDFERWYRQAERSSNAVSEAQLRTLEDLRAHSLFAGYYDVFAAQLLPLNAEQLEAKLGLNTYALRFLPVPDTVFRQAALLALRGDREQAEATYRRLVKMYPEEQSVFLGRLERMAREDPKAFDDLAGAARRMTAR